MHSFSEIRDLLVGAWKDFGEDKATRLAAALAYFTIFSLAPLLVIAISIAGLVFGEQAARGALTEQLNSLLGAQGAEAVEQLLAASAGQERAGIVATVVGVVTLLFGAAGVFGQLQDALNTIWEVAPRPDRGIKGFIKDRFLSFAMVLSTGFLLLVSLLLSAILTAVSRVTFSAVGGAFDQTLIWQGVNVLVQIIVTFGLFAMIFKVLPDVEISWRDVMFGAGVTTLLFALGRVLIDLYLRTTGTGSAYGAIGSLIVLLIWIFYSAQILLFGAELTQVYAQKFGSRIVPSSSAVAVTAEARARQGMPDRETVRAAAEGRGGEGAAAQGRAADEEPTAQERAVGEPPWGRGEHIHSSAEAGPAAEPERKRGGAGATVLAGATIAATLGALVRGLGRRRR